ncbi:MAG: DinB family protein [Oscillospiraceae bacterium]|nr:DinB family protein [Oscillospiraceae bacterium]
MKKTLSELILPQVDVMFRNLETALRTFDPQAELFNMPLWKHAYHMLHSCDRWLINPCCYDEPTFHTPGLNSLDEPVLDLCLDREDLLAYLADIREKCLDYVRSLRDEDWTKAPHGCPHTRLELLLGQLRHAHAHLGNINAVTMQQTGRWPRVIGLQQPVSGELWE